MTRTGPILFKRAKLGTDDPSRLETPSPEQNLILNTAKVPERPFVVIWVVGASLIFWVALIIALFVWVF